MPVLLALAPLLAGCGSQFELRRIEPAQTVRGTVVGPYVRRLERRIGTAIDFVTPARGFMATRGGELRRTDDGGQTWTVVATGRHFVSVSFPGRTTGFALSARGRLLSTRDGGRSWRILHSFGRPPDEGPFSGAVEFVDSRHGWAAPGGDLYRTVDGGATWHKLSFRCGLALGGFSFVDRSHGFLICGGQPATIDQEKNLYVTADAGRTWRLRACVRAVGLRCHDNLALEGFAAGLAFRDSRAGLLVTDRGGIARTLDGGTRWHDTLFTDDAYTVISTSWASARTVYALIEQDGSLLRSDDAGGQWRRVSPAGPGPPTGAMAFFTPRRGIGISAGRLLAPGGIVATSDGGMSWRRVSGVRAQDQAFARVGRRSVWAIGVRRRANGSWRSVLLRSQDEGRHWRRMPAPPEADIATLTFPTPKIGYFVDVEGRLFRSADGGSSWRLVRSRRRNLEGAVFYSARRGLLGADFGLVRTEDGGHSWQPVRVGAGLRIGSVSILDPRHWWLTARKCSQPRPRLAKGHCSSRVSLLRTADGGRSWTAIEFDHFPAAPVPVFATRRVGYVAYAPFGVYRTADGGRTWRFVSAPAQCAASEPALTVQSQGEATQAVIFLLLANRGSRPCAASGAAEFEIQRAGHPGSVSGSPLTVDVSTRVPPGGQRPLAHVWWANWCGSPRRLSVVVRYRGHELRSRFNALPACIRRVEPSTLSLDR